MAVRVQSPPERAGPWTRILSPVVAGATLVGAGQLLCDTSIRPGRIWLRMPLFHPVLWLSIYMVLNMNMCLTCSPADFCNHPSESVCLQSPVARSSPEGVYLPVCRLCAWRERLGSVWWSAHRVGAHGGVGWGRGQHSGLSV